MRVTKLWIGAGCAVSLLVALVVGVLLFRTRQEQTTTVAEITTVVEGIAFTPDGQTLAFGTLDAGAELRRLDGTLVRSIGKGRVNALVFTPDGTLLITCGGGEASQVQVWRVADGTLLRTLDPALTAWAYNLALAPDGMEIAVATPDGVPLFRLDDGGHVRTLPSSGTSVAYTPDGAQIIVGANLPTMHIFDRATGNELHRFPGHGLDVAVSPDGTRMAAPGWDDDTKVQLWNTATGEPTAQFAGHTGQVHSVAFAPDGQTLVSGDNNGTVILWRVGDGAVLNRLTFPRGVDRVAFSPDGRQVAMASWYTVHLWQLPPDAGE